MAKIDRYQGNLQAFASGATGQERVVFGQPSSAPTQSDDLTENINAAFTRGWGTVPLGDKPPREWFNSAAWVSTQLSAYLHQVGVAEWDDEQEYHEGSIVNVGGLLYSSLSDSNVGNAVTGPEWVKISNKELTTEGLINSGASELEGTTIRTTGFYANGDGGSALWRATSTTGLAPMQAPSDLGEAALVDGLGRRWEMVHGDFVNALSLGVLNDGTETGSVLQGVLFSGIKLLFPDGDYRIDATEGPVSGYSSGPAIVMDGLQDIHLKGSGGARFLSGSGDAVSFFLLLTSQAQADEGNYSSGITFEDLVFVVDDHATASTQSVINLTSTIKAKVLGCTFDAGTNNVDNVLGVTGTGGINNFICRNTFLGIATCTDNSQFYQCTFEENKCVGNANAVTGFNHFYDLVTIGNVRFPSDPPTPIASGNIFSNNDISGYPTALALRGMRDSHVTRNKIHDVTYSLGSERNIISVFTQAGESDIGYPVRGIVIDHNIIWNYNNTGGATMRGIYLGRSDGTYSVYGCSIHSNILHDMTNCIGISEDNISEETQIFGNAVDPSSVTTPYGRNVIEIRPGQQSGFSPSIETSGGDLTLIPADGRYVRFGDYTSSPGSSVAGYIEIRDEAGNVRRLAVIS